MSAGPGPVRAARTGRGRRRAGDRGPALPLVRVRAVARCIRARSADPEDTDAGQTTVVLIGFALVSLLLVVTVLAITSVYVGERQLQSLADRAAGAAADTSRASRVLTRWASIAEPTVVAASTVSTAVRKVPGASQGGVPGTSSSHPNARTLIR